MLILLLGASYYVQAQSRVKLVEAKSLILYSEGENFLQPFIENTLRNLTRAKFLRTQRVFDNVSSLNRFLSNSQYQRDLVDLLDTQVSEEQAVNGRYNAEQLKIRKRVLDRLTGYDVFLVVKTNVLGELVEFQFLLFKAIKSNPGNAPYNITDELLASEDIFINPKDPDYKLHIVNAINRLFPESNSRPEASLQILGNKVTSGQTIRVPENTVITLDGSQSGDYETEQLQYIWENAGHSFEKKQEIDKIIFSEKNTPVQRVSINRYGHYVVNFKVYDGAAYSDTISVTIIPTFKAKLDLYDTVAMSHQFRSVFADCRYFLEYPNPEGKFLFFTVGSASKDALIAADKPLPYTRKSEITKWDTDTTIRVTDTTAFATVFIQSDFRFGSSRTVYLYTYDEAGFLSDPVPVTHVYRRRNVCNLYMMGSVAQLGDTNEENDLTSTKFFPEIGVGFFITKHLELGFSYPLGKSFSQITDRSIKIFGTTRVAAKFHFYERAKKPYRDFDNIHSWYLMVNYAQAPTSIKHQLADSFGGGMGLSVSILSGSFGNLNGMFEVSYSRFVSSEVKQLDEVSARFGVILNPRLF